MTTPTHGNDREPRSRTDLEPVGEGWWKSVGAPTGMERLEEYRARGTDEEVHIVEAPPDALVDPSPYRSRCGQPLIVVYNDHPELTCRLCSGAH